MPDLLDDLRRYGDAVEAAALERTEPNYPVTAEPSDRRGRRPSRRAVLVGVAAALAVALLVGVAVLRSGGHDSVRIDTPPTSSTVVTPSLPPRPALPPVAAEELDASPAVWSAIVPGPLAPRDGQAAVWTGSEMILWGGVLVPFEGDPAALAGDGATYDPETDSWRELQEAPISPRVPAVSAWTGDELLIWGAIGTGTGVADLVDGGAYDPSTDSWRTISSSPLAAGLQYHGVWTGDELFIIGFSPQGSDAAAYDPLKDRWRELTAPAVASMTATSPIDVRWTGSRIVVVETLPLDEPVTVFIYDPQADRWTTSVPPNFAARSLEAVVLDGRLFLISYQADLDGAIAFDSESGDWAQRVLLSRLACEAGPTATALSSSLLVQDGCGRAAIYDPTSVTVQPVEEPSPVPGFPISRISALVWTGDALIGWGYFAASDPANFHRQQAFSLTP